MAARRRPPWLCVEVVAREARARKPCTHSASTRARAPLSVPAGPLQTTGSSVFVHGELPEATVRLDAAPALPAPRGSTARAPSASDSPSRHRHQPPRSDYVSLASFLVPVRCRQAIGARSSLPSLIPVPWLTPRTAPLILSIHTAAHRRTTQCARRQTPPRDTPNAGVPSIQCREPEPHAPGRPFPPSPLPSSALGARATSAPQSPRRAASAAAAQAWAAATSSALTGAAGPSSPPEPASLRGATQAGPSAVSAPTRPRPAMHTPREHPPHGQLPLQTPLTPVSRG